MKDRQPAFLFYPGDWLRDPVAGCSLAAQGLWLRMLMVMHDNDPRGQIPGREFCQGLLAFARRCGCSEEAFRSAFEELETAQIFSRLPDGTVYSRRMERERKLSEARRLAGKKGGHAKAGTLPGFCHDKTGAKKAGKKLANIENENEDEDMSLRGGVGGGQRSEKQVERDALWDALVAEWKLPVGTPTQRSRIGRLVTELRGAGAIPSEIAVRRKRIVDAWGAEKATPESVVKHWSEFDGSGPNQSRVGRVEAPPGKYDGVMARATVTGSPKRGGATSESKLAFPSASQEPSA